MATYFVCMLSSLLRRLCCFSLKQCQSSQQANGKHGQQHHHQQQKKLKGANNSTKMPLCSLVYHIVCCCLRIACKKILQMNCIFTIIRMMVFIRNTYVKPIKLVCIAGVCRCFIVLEKVFVFVCCF